MMMRIRDLLCTGSWPSEHVDTTEGVTRTNNLSLFCLFSLVNAIIGVWQVRSVYNTTSFPLFGFE
jgi:hypothetical protein